VNKTQTDEPGWTSRLDGRASGANPGPPAAAHPGERDVAVIFRQHHADLVRLALLLVGDRASAEDVVQDVFTRLCARDQELHRDTALSYVRTAVVNACRTVLRRRALGRRIAAARAAQPDTQESAEHTAIQAEDRRRVMAALAALPTRLILYSGLVRSRTNVDELNGWIHDGHLIMTRFPGGFNREVSEAW
jgi:hypothetical protein